MSAPAAEAKASTADASPRTEPVEPSAGSPVRDAKAAGASESKAGDAKATEAVGDPDPRVSPYRGDRDWDGGEWEDDAHAKGQRVDAGTQDA